MQRVLITGGLGYIASHLAAELARRGVRCVLLDNLSVGSYRNVAFGEFVEGDIRDDILLAQLFSEFRFDTLFHLAGMSDVRQSFVEEQAYYDTNVLGSHTLFSVAASSGTQKIIFASSGAVYDPDSAQPLQEKRANIAPVSPYGKQKQEVESLLQSYVDKGIFCATSLRLFVVAGYDLALDMAEPLSRAPHLIPKLIRLALSDETFCIYGEDWQTLDGTCVRDYVHVTDVVEAMLVAEKTMSKMPEAHTVNVGTGRGYSVLQILARVQALMGHPIRHVIVGSKSGDASCLVACTEQAQSLLGWQARHSRVSDILDSELRFQQRNLAQK